MASGSTRKAGVHITYLEYVGSGTVQVDYRVFNMGDQEPRPYLRVRATVDGEPVPGAYNEEPLDPRETNNNTIMIEGISEGAHTVCVQAV